MKKFLRELASKKPTPGGGSVSALSGAIAAGLVSMAAKISGNQEVAEKSERLMKVLVELIDKDSQAFEMAIKAKSSPDALKEATEIPLLTAKYAYEVLKLAETLAKSCKIAVLTDVAVATKMAEAAVEGAVFNVKVNLLSIKDENYKKKIKQVADELYLTGWQARAILSQIKARFS